jgi:hypothetical protein
MLPLVFQASSSFDGMAGKAKVTDVNNAFSLADTMSIGDLFTKKSKKNSRKAGDLPKETGAKKARMIPAKRQLLLARPLPPWGLLIFQALSYRVSLDFIWSIFV